jgi:hypothetical protein
MLSDLDTAAASSQSTTTKKVLKIQNIQPKKEHKLTIIAEKPRELKIDDIKRVSPDKNQRKDIIVKHVKPMSPLKKYKPTLSI